jgi:hypothetical protein
MRDAGLMFKDTGIETVVVDQRDPSTLTASFKPPAATAPMLQEVFNLDEGPVTLTFPSNLTQDSYEELESALKLFLLRQQRRARRGGGQNEEAAN